MNPLDLMYKSPKEVAAGMRELAKTWTVNKLRRSLEEMKAKNPKTYGWVDVEAYVDTWAKEYGFRDDPDSNEFGEVCP